MQQIFSVISTHVYIHNKIRWLYKSERETNFVGFLNGSIEAIFEYEKTKCPDLRQTSNLLS